MSLQRALKTLSSLTAKTLLLCAALAPMAALADDFDDGIKAYQKGDYRTAERLWTPLADKGEAKAQFNLGFLFAQGLGSKQDMKHAMDLWLKAAGQNYTQAELNLGAVYSEGQAGIAKDDKEAAKWFLKAAQQGDKEGETGIANMYASGRGVARDPKEAAKWYKSAMKEGYAPAFAGYAALYERGDGVPKDVIKAHMYYNVAAATSTGDEATKATAERDRVAKGLQPADVAKARAMAKKCMSTNYAQCDG